tara:strand:- start:6424 stop:6816 length:393 start_codon:yes stop_codon:yes gene_type:complete
MAYRDDLLANTSVSLASTSVSVSQELPFDSAGVPLYEKNMKKLYIGEDNTAREPLIPVLDFNPVENVVTIVTAFLTIDAKNPLTDIDTITAAVINSKNSISNQITRNCAMVTDFTDDRLTYQFEFEFTTI